MQMTENPDYVRRRGRWITNKVMEIYIQEVAAIMYLPRLPVSLKERIFAVANFFENMLVQAKLWTTWQFPKDTHGIFSSATVLQRPAKVWTPVCKGCQMRTLVVCYL